MTSKCLWPASNSVEGVCVCVCVDGDDDVYYVPEMVLNISCGLANPHRILYEVGSVIPISKMRDVRHREVK